MDIVDIFRKEKDGTLVWIAAVGQLHTAAARVAELSQESPGRILCLRPAHGEDDSITGTVANRVRNLTLDCVASSACSLLAPNACHPL